MLCVYIYIYIYVYDSDLYISTSTCLQHLIRNRYTVFYLIGVCV